MGSSSAEFHVTLQIDGTVKKNIHSLDTTAINSELVRALKLPDNSEFTVQLFKEKYNDWIDIHEGNEKCLSDGGRLLVIVQDSKKVNDSRSDGRSSGTTEQNSSSCAIRVSPSQKHMWTTPYKLPVHTFPKALLNCNESPGRTLRGRLLDVIYDDVTTKFTLYPLGSQYNDIIDSLFEAYPHFRNEDGLQGNDARVLWRNRIRGKFINGRRRKEQDQAVVQERKLKRQSSQVMVNTETASVPLYGVKNYLLSRPPGEDDVSIARHVKWMQEEKKTRPRKPDYAKIRILMSRTFADRRVQIVKDCASASAILLDYPWLADDEELCLEYRRLTEDDVEQKLLTALTDFGVAIVGEVKTQAKKPSIVQELFESMQTKKTEDERKYALVCAAILAIPSLLREDLSMVFGPVENLRDDTPVFIGHGGSCVFLEETEFSVFVEGVLLCETGDLLKAFAVFLAAFYVFNLEFPSGLTRTLLFCDKIILAIEDKTCAATRPKKVKAAHKQVLSLISKLNDRRKKSATKN